MPGGVCVATQVKSLRCSPGDANRLVSSGHTLGAWGPRGAAGAEGLGCRMEPHLRWVPLWAQAAGLALIIALLSLLLSTPTIHTSQDSAGK